MSNKNKHLTKENRKAIENMLGNGESFKAIGRELGKDPTTISKEIKSHLIFERKGGFGCSFNNCAFRFDCYESNLCTNHCNSDCRRCSKSLCRKYCNRYEEEICQKLSAPPYVCNGCIYKFKCTLEKRNYRHRYANDEYKFMLKEAREGANLTEEEVINLNNMISPLIQKGQSINHIYHSLKDEIMVDRRSLYRYINQCLFTARAFDLPRSGKYKPRNKVKTFKVDRACRVGRTYEDFKALQAAKPGICVVEMDSVKGTASSGKVLLTLIFPSSSLFLAFIRSRNTAASVAQIFTELRESLSYEDYNKLFSVILTDNGSEFSNPKSIEFDKNGELRSNVFYCNPSSPEEKGTIENVHTLLRRIIPKGTSLDDFTQEDINLVVSHINSYKREKFGGKSPYEVFESFYGKKILEALGINCVPPQDIILKPTLLK